MADSSILGTEDVLCQELDEIERRRERRPDPHAERVHDDLETHDQRAQRLNLSALCLSGGGIRSAAFCLGVLQGLAEKHMLRQFDFVSTVSGGGFIGGWLQVLIRESGGVSGTEEAISNPQPEALRRLRAFTNYLTPQTGPLSIDTWAGIVLYLRNLLINWAVFAPLFLLIALIPIGYRTAIWVCSDFQWVNLALLACAGLALLFGVVRACSLLPSHREQRSSDDPTPSYASVGSIRWGIVYPALGWTLLIPWLLDFADGPLAEGVPDRPWLAHHTFWLVPIIYLVLMTLGFRLAWSLQSHRVDPGFLLFKANFRRWILASIGAALLTWFLLKIAASILPLELPSGQGGASFLVDTATALTVFAPLALAVVHVLQTSLYVALRRETELADLDREWLGRVNAMILRLAVGWTLFALACLILPVTINLVRPGDAPAQWSGGSITLTAAITILGGGTAAWLGKIWPSIEHLAEKPAVWDRVRACLPVALGLLFGACLLVVFGGVLNFVLAQLQLTIASLQDVAVPNQPKLLQLILQQPKWLPLILQLLVGATLFIGVMTFQHVNVNRFSMHAVYRNRLTRAFLGSARNKREQDPFTGFDPRDNTPLSELLKYGTSLFPVINMTLNITAGNNTAWAERKAASFTATPLACGSAELRHPGQSPGAIDPCGAYVPTSRFAGLETLKEHPKKATESGPGLGSALTVSGAAVSPTWGYHSSRITAFLMTLFNVRLGIWLPNPSTATADELRLARPRNSLMALIDEMLGETTDDSQAIYLSDGGHFENLGLYEMFRRRCSSILVIDAGADETCSLFDLGNAIRKSEIDLGTRVVMRDPMHLYARARLDADLETVALGCATGDIFYSNGHIGRLLYVKPSFLSQIPADVRSYGAEHKAFPHETTLDQWFSESQFESYRKLGRYQSNVLVKGVADGDLSGMFGAHQPPANDGEPAESVIAVQIAPAEVDAERIAAE
jgi:hypothetical protein